MTTFKITGMSCAACSTRVEKAVSSLKNVSSCSVNLLTNSMVIEGDATCDEIIAAVNAAGYGAEIIGSDKSDLFKGNEALVLKRRLLFSIIFTIPLMYISMGHMMFNFLLPDIIKRFPNIIIIQAVLAAIVMIINRKFYINGVTGLIKKSPNMDTLVAIGSTASYLSGSFESAATILTLITVGKTLEAISKGKTTNAIKGLMDLSPKTAVIEVDGKEKTVSVSEVRKGDIFVVKPGERIPVDGIIISGESAVNESALTGESIPVDKVTNDCVFCATINQSGFIKCRATKVGADTTLSQIVKMVSDATSTKALAQRIADKVSGIFVPVVIIISIITVISWFFAGYEFTYALKRGISVLVISCPCALGLATPVAIMVGNGVGARNGILFKTAAALEAAGKVQVVALDKTGTITKGEPLVTDIIPASGFSDNELLFFAASLEAKSEHPIARAVTKMQTNLNIPIYDAKEFTVLPGNGLSGKINGEKIYGGSLRYIETICNIPDTAYNQLTFITSQGKTPLLFAKNSEFIGIICVADTIKDDSKFAIKALKDMGIRVAMITGDNKRTAEAIGHEVGVDEVFSEVLPDGKEKIIQKLSEMGKVAMVGDGINDAPALTRADTGIAIGAGSDIAIDAADIVLMKNSLSDIPAVIRLSKKTLKNIHENLFWAFIYNIIGIPIAAGLLIKPFGITLSPTFSALAMSLSSFCVVSNALKLNLINLKKTDGRKTTMKKITIEGMMCEHCEAHVKNALESLNNVEEAKVSHKKGTAVVTLSDSVSDEALLKAVEDEGYKVVAIE